MRQQGVKPEPFIDAREFDRAFVLVNPSRLKQTYELPGELHDIHGQPVSGTITLPKFSRFLFAKDPSILPR